jgi:ribosomal protein S20
MPNKHAAIKDLRKNKKRSARNARMKIHVKALTAQLKLLVKDGKKAEATEVARKLQQAVDKAAKNNVFHANKSAHKASSAHRMIKGLK